MIPREWISNVKIERRGEDGGMNITLFVEPPAKANYKLPAYGELTLLAEGVFRDVMNASSKEFVQTHADVMAWSKGHEVMSVPHQYRVTMNLYPPDQLEDGDEDV